MKCGSWLPLTLLLGACSAPSPFLDLGPLTDAQVVSLLRARTDVTTLAAELVIDYEDPDVGGTFDAVAYFERPARMRLHAFKDVIVAVEPVFDLLFEPDTYAMTMRDPDSDEPKPSNGPAVAFPHEHPRLAGFFWGREAFCLPGSLDPDQTPTITHTENGELRIETRLSSGARVTWIASARTLEVRQGIVTAPGGGRTVFDYADYVLLGGTFVPGTLRYDDGTTNVEAEISEVELNPTLDAATWVIDAE